MAAPWFDSCISRKRRSNQVLYDYCYCPYPTARIKTFSVYGLFFFLYRIPTLPCGKVGDKDGFLFETETQKRASYYHAIDSLGLLTQDGCPLSYDRWLDSTFCLPFRLSHELNTYTPQQADRILQEPAVPLARSRLFLAFKKSTTYVVR